MEKTGTPGVEAGRDHLEENAPGNTAKDDNLGRKLP